jgi:predicted RNase H-like HicB family nuclease
MELLPTAPIYRGIYDGVNFSRIPIAAGWNTIVMAAANRVPHGVSFGPQMRNEFTAIIEQDDEWFVAYCPEVPGANGQGRTKEEARKNLADAISLILEDRREDGLRGIEGDATR